MKPQLTFLTAVLAGALATPVAAKQALQFNDVFDFKYPQHTVLGEQGQYLAFSAEPYRGDAQGQVYNLDNNELIATVARGTAAQINKNSQWVAFTQVPTLLNKESTDKKARKKLKNNLVLVNTQTGAQQSFEQVKDYQLSDDGRWLAYRLHSSSDQDADNEKEKADTGDDLHISADKKDKTYDLVIVDLTSNEQTRLDSVFTYAISHTSAGIVFNQHSSDGSNNQVSYFDFASQRTDSLIDEPGVTVSTIEWHPVQNLVAFNVGNYVNDDTRRRDYRTMLWHGQQNTLETLPSQWQAGKKGTLSWSEDGARLYFTTRPELDAKVTKKKYQDAQSLRDFDTIVAQANIEVWHHQDPEIKPREKQQWQKEKKYRHYQAVYHLNGKKVVQLADEQVPKVRLNKKADHLIGYSNLPYLHEMTYKGFYNDYYAIDVLNGSKQVIVKAHPHRPSLSPIGQHEVYFSDQGWQLKDLANNTVTPLSKAVNAVFADDKHDYPSEVDGYGVAGWYKDGSKVLINSKYDIWAFDVESGEAQVLTQGQAKQVQYRVVNLDDDKLGFDDQEQLLLRAFNVNNKQTQIGALDLANNTVRTLLAGEARFDVKMKAKHADKYIFTKQSYHQFPDFWQADAQLTNPRQITDLNPQISQFKWGQKPELVSYKGYDGEDLQGVLIKPADYVEGEQVPVVIYFYRYMSQRRYDFPKMELNHRPNFPMFTSNGYAVFLPDIRFEIGKPGPSSTQTMINAAQKLIDMGVAKKDAIGLQGHSWAGYQSAFMVTQTDMFKAVVSGAPVSNMTSAYSGIRLKSGLARQFQYETGQSRIGKALYEDVDAYIDNSPVFFADKINTPIMIMFGNEDGAVPWQEGIQYYLALRRAGKEVIFLEYDGEPHHLKQFPNQVDFSIRMMQYFNHHLKGEPAPQWMTQGVPFIEE
ncbi:S9 family peptidase [Pseudoalteromonas ruthenica]|uniref:S9 family peptidase n=1 Tax=Pseudoalteromonas ruthenica TaxID=151081 RepID=UPI0012472D96|nr:prolyl oligopeptidase family serine peptidase [Pseudoalteromonas ruthenica]